MFQDRFDAARQLAKKLQKYKHHSQTILLAIPRGGLEIGQVLAKELQLPLDIILTKKIGAPGNEEYAIGAVSLHGHVVDDSVGVSQDYIKSEVKRLQKKLQERYEMYHQGRKPFPIQGKTIILVDDGVATGRTLFFAIDLLRKEKPAKIIVALPVGPLDTIARLRRKADEVICLETPPLFFAIGEFYTHFRQVEDEEAIRLLEKANEKQ